MDDTMDDIAVLLIEDNCDDEWITLRVLNKVGLINVSVARDGHEALLMLHGDEPDICSPGIIFLDLRLPKIDGLEVLKRIRSDDRTKNSTVFILTSSEDPHDKEVCSELGVTAFLTKPLTKEDIVSLNLLPIDRATSSR